MDQQRLRELLGYDVESGRFVWRQANKAREGWGCCWICRQ